MNGYFKVQGLRTVQEVATYIVKAASPDEAENTALTGQVNPSQRALERVERWETTLKIEALDGDIFCHLNPAQIHVFVYRTRRKTERAEVNSFDTSDEARAFLKTLPALMDYVRGDIYNYEEDEHGVFQALVGTWTPLNGVANLAPYNW